MKTNLQQTRRGFTLVELLVVIVIIASLAALSSPLVFRQVKRAAEAQALSNARQIGFALFEFQNDYGSYPSAATLTQLNEVFPSETIRGAAGTDSNGYFKQLFQAGLSQSEEIFFAKAQGVLKPDGDISTDARALAAGEVGFGYILDGVEGLSTAGNPSRPVIATPLAVGSTTEFDGDPFNKKAVVLRIDNSALSVNIRVPAGSTENKGAAILGGQDLLSSTNPIWSGGSPGIRAQLKKK
jgi:prepilin-type N-terminal cleavage/methylation domain-containing protein